MAEPHSFGNLVQITTGTEELTNIYINTHLYTHLHKYTHTHTHRQH